MTKRTALAATILLAGIQLHAQEAGSSGLTARELYYREDPAVARKPPPVRRPRPKVTPAATATATAGPAANPKPQPKVEAAVTTPSGVAVIPAAAQYLGARYNVLQLMNRETNKRVAVDPDTAFRAGDCVALEVEANRDAYLHVFNRGTSGAWQQLFPSSEMEGENNRIYAGEFASIPEEHCFEFDRTAGTERMLVVITERAEDMRRLSEAMRLQKGGGDGGAPRPPAPAAGPTMLAGGALVREIETFREGQLIGRDIKIAKVGKPQRDDEQPHAVYAVRTASISGDRLMIEILLKHE